MSWKGSSNIGPSGFTIDLQKLNSISLSNDRSVVSIGAGARWRTVYRFLDPYNLTTVGGDHMSWKGSPNIGPSGFAMQYRGRPGFSAGLSPAHQRGARRRGVMERGKSDWNVDRRWRPHPRVLLFLIPMLLLF